MRYIAVPHIGLWRDASEQPTKNGSYFIITPNGWAEAEYRVGNGWFQYRWSVKDPEVIQWAPVECKSLEEV